MSTVLEKGQAAIANVGGPARLVEWCPPVDGSTTQHLAVVAGTSGPEVTVDQNGSTSDSVQIWRLAVGDDGSLVLQLRSKLLIKGGAVVAVRWCPGTAADAHTPLNLPRLGVLAVATGSVVQLFAVPRLDHESCVGITPVLRCVDGVVQCTALCWSTDPDHKWLYVGRADGSVAVYCVGSIGGDSDAAAVDTLVRVPVTVLDGLDGRVRAVECCPVDPGLLVVTGHDEVLQLWDVGKQECIDQICTVPMPFRRRKREVVWPTEHSGMFYVAEELSLRFLEPGIKPLLKRVTHSAGEILTATVSEWRRLVAVGCGSLVLPRLGVPPPPFHPTEI
jgi:WD40 repeat protein